MAKSGTERLNDHIARSGGRRATFVLSQRAVLALEFLREERGFSSDTETVNYALQRAAADLLSVKGVEN